MELKRTDRMWGISVFVAGIATMILVGSNLVGVRLPDMVVRITGVLDSIALFALAFLSAKKLIKRDLGKR